MKHGFCRWKVVRILKGRARDDVAYRKYLSVFAGFAANPCGYQAALGSRTVAKPLFRIAMALNLSLPGVFAKARKRSEGSRPTPGTSP